MCLADALYRLDIPIALAHVNYKLRGADSDLDADLVQNWALERKLPAHIKIVDLSGNQSSIQAKAREVRYTFFNQLSEDLIATAHHQSDQIETAFLQLLRGKQVLGIPERRKRIIRPILAADPESLERHCENFNVPYRVDKSNASDRYLRNRIRHRLLPLLPELKENATPHILNAIHEHHHLSCIARDAQHLWTEQFITREGDSYIIHVQNIAKCYRASVLSTICQPYGFHRDQIYQLLESQKGALSQSSEWNILVENHYWSLHKPSMSKNVDQESVSMDQYGELTLGNRSVSISQQENYILSDDLDTEYVDAHLLKFPVTLRRWQSGDRMKPIGMNGQSKKVADLLQDAKVAHKTKSEHLVLVNAYDEIIWLVGIRLSESVQLNKQSSTVAKLLTFRL